MARCVICRKEIGFLKRAAFGMSFYDKDTEENFCICPKCGWKIPKTYVQDLRSGVRAALVKWHETGAISDEDLDRTYKDSISIIAKKYLKTATPTFGMWLHDVVIVDEPTKRLLIGNKIINFSDIESYQIFDNAIEYNIQSPNTTQYDFNTEHGLRRTIVGGIIAGPAGAVMGGLTSKHSLSVNEGMKASYSTTEHDFKVLINLKTLAYGGCITVIVGNSVVKLQSFANLLDRLQMYC